MALFFIALSISVLFAFILSLAIVYFKQNPEAQLRKAAKSAVCKINIDSDLRLALTAGIREHFVQHPEHFDPRQYLAPGRAYIKELVEHKIKEVLGSDGSAPAIMELAKELK